MRRAGRPGTGGIGREREEGKGLLETARPRPRHGLRAACRGIGCSGPADRPGVCRRVVSLSSCSRGSGSRERDHLCFFGLTQSEEPRQLSRDRIRGRAQGFR